MPLQHLVTMPKSPIANLANTTEAESLDHEHAVFVRSPC
jgi:hypothetical protein